MKELASRFIPARLLDAWRAWRASMRYRHARSLDPSRYPDAIKRWYKSSTGVELDLDNPSTFDEKIQWLKLYDSTPEKGRLSDKYLVRDWVASRVGERYLVPLVGVWESAGDIDFESLPDRFVLKATHGCGWNVIVRDKETLDTKAVRAQLRSWLATDYSFVEWFELQYQHCTPRIIAEAYLENTEGDLHDYKFFCFGGKVECVGFVRGRMTHAEEACFDAEWNRLPCIYCSHPRIEGSIPKPKGFEEALRVAEALSAGFPHVRVDLYLTNEGRVYFGEMTFTTMSGNCAWDPPEYNDVFGRMIDLTTLPAWKQMHGGERREENADRRRDAVE
ncbi:MAG: hypothetical protein IJ131_09610 [Eggerthellaceae bacterium]|nr:hypothetical protein [Eggerthellaceae bacterium]